MSYEVKKLYTEKAGRIEVDPAVMFPATVARIKEVLEGEIPAELSEKKKPMDVASDPAVVDFYKQASALPEGALDLALAPYSALAVKEGASDEEKAEAAAILQVRAQALLLAESYFQRALLLALGKGALIHITKNEDFRR